MEPDQKQSVHPIWFDHFPFAGPMSEFGELLCSPLFLVIQHWTCCKCVPLGIQQMATSSSRAFPCLLPKPLCHMVRGFQPGKIIRNMLVSHGHGYGHGLLWFWGPPHPTPPHSPCYYMATPVGGLDGWCGEINICPAWAKDSPKTPKPKPPRLKPLKLPQTTLLEATPRCFCFCQRAPF